MIRKNLCLLAALVLLSGSCKEDTEEKNIDTPEIEFKKEGELFIVKPEGDTIQYLDIEIADNNYERATGLMYRRSMENDQGMLFIFPDAAPRYFYMKNTYIPLDILYFASDSTAISFQENTEPLSEESLPSEGPAQFVLELNAGLVQEWQIEKGDKIYFEKSNE
ncbi:DUF192 domain-containing protein [Salegentibacter chungangensis]|uniref:DUF192 domain-containing protein n=1 Tax=Salegentibacter chungangensis TaxID=1335724 RepID=A0ABW3NW23_9FLAO